MVRESGVVEDKGGKVDMKTMESVIIVLKGKAGSRGRMTIPIYSS